MELKALSPGAARALAKTAPTNRSEEVRQIFNVIDKQLSREYRGGFVEVRILDAIVSDEVLAEVKQLYEDAGWEVWARNKAPWYERAYERYIHGTVQPYGAKFTLRENEGP